MHAALERPVKESGGAYYQGLRKGMLRIKEKAEADYAKVMRPPSRLMWPALSRSFEVFDKTALAAVWGC
ncbi:hypothetical protein JL721_3268 [Aureococcus anophagefferens]|nr:hypothetical protein JL721_3268 [Aureococcus anophagefferens]